MFTGLVEEIGEVLSLKMSGSEGRLRIGASKVLEGLGLGHSIAVNGACLTVAELGPSSFTASLMPETLHRTNLGRLRPRSPVNLERALALGGRLGGHLVQGHIDGLGQVRSMIPEGEALVVTISAPPEIMRYVVPQGFIAVDGVSLTVVERDEASFTVSLVAYTQEHITLPRQGIGYMVNLEVDILAKYVESLLGQERPARQGLSREFLAEHGFLG